MIKLASLALCIFLVTGCNSNPGSADSQVPSKNLDGFEGIAFGTSLSDALGQLPSQLFNPVSVTDCFGKVTTESCTLFAAEGPEGIYKRKFGIPYHLSLEFDKLDRLVSIQLGYTERKEFDRKSCLDVLARTNAWMTSEFGPGRANRNLKFDTEKKITLPAYGASAISVHIDDSGRIADDFIYDRGMNGQNANLFVTAIPAIPLCKVTASIENVPAIDLKSKDSQEPK